MYTETCPTTRHKKIRLFLLLLMVSLTLPNFAQVVVWDAWETKPLTALSDDNTGTLFAFSDAVLNANNVPTLMITPSGTAPETKLAWTLSGETLITWAQANTLELDVYLPEEAALSPNMFFLGMANVGGIWSWVDGVFGTISTSKGWGTVSFQLSAPMKKITLQDTYTLFLSFFHESSGRKQPLIADFYLGQMRLNSTNSPQAVVLSETIETLLAQEDPALLDTIAELTFRYFWQEANPQNGLIKDRSTPSSPASIAAVGFGLTALTIGVERGWITEQEGYERALTTLKTFAEGGVQGERGFYYHFVDMQSGERVWESELSSIDTALFIAGALTVGQYFADSELTSLAEALYSRVDWQWMMNGKATVSMGWKPESGFLPYHWSNFDEGLLLYVLAIASPTYPAPVSMWSAMNRPIHRTDESIFLASEPLFVYQYPQAYLDLRHKEDAFANYFNNTIKACDRNRAFSSRLADKFITYQHGVWGISASDGMRGYRAYGASNGNHDGTIAPYASIACLPFTPTPALASIRAMLTQYGTQVWGKYGFFSAFNAQADWFSTDYIGIDQGDTLLMIANYQEGFVWQYFMRYTPIQQALQAVGFVESQANYAVTPSYLEASR